MSLVSNLLGTVRRVQFIQSDKTVFEIECTVKEDHSRESTATKFEVENGTGISDHIILRPYALVINGFISDTSLNLGKGLLTTAVASLVPGPLGVIGQALGSELISAIMGSSSPSVEAYNALTNLQETKQPFDVRTTLRLYKNMFITNLTVPREAASGNVLEFTVNLEQLILVAPVSVNIQVFTNPDLSAASQNKGKQEMGDGTNFFAKGQAAFHSTTGL